MSRDEIPPGTLHVLILKTLAGAEELHGFEVAEAIERLSGDILRVEEMRLHVELRGQRLSGSTSPDDADRRARIRFGNLTRIHEDAMEVWRWRMTDQLAQDLRIGTRALMRHPAYTLTAIVTLALGI